MPLIPETFVIQRGREKDKDSGRMSLRTVKHQIMRVVMMFAE